MKEEKDNNGLKNQDIMEVKAGNKVVEFGKEKQSQADTRRS